MRRDVKQDVIDIYYLLGHLAARGQSIQIHRGQYPY